MIGNIFNSTIVPRKIASSPLRSQPQAINDGNARKIIAFSTQRNTVNYLECKDVRSGTSLQR